MFISRIPKYRQRPDGTIEKYDYYRLSENWRDADGKIRKRTVVNLGELPGYTKAGRKELGALLEEISQLHWPPLQCGPSSTAHGGEGVDVRKRPPGSHFG